MIRTTESSLHETSRHFCHSRSRKRNPSTLLFLNIGSELEELHYLTYETTASTFAEWQLVDAVNTSLLSLNQRRTKVLFAATHVASLRQLPY
jgi:hypothetical protein